MQITLEKTESGDWCLFDNRSSSFFPGGVVRDYELGQDMVGLANSIVRSPKKKIFEIAQNKIYGDTGYLENMIASKYLAMNPDIVLMPDDKIKHKIDKKTVYTGKKRGRKPKLDKIVSPVVEGEKKKRGRPRKVVNE